MGWIGAVACLALWAAAVARAQDDRLVVVQDESSMERTIESYLKSKHQLVINEKFPAPEDLVLVLPFSAKDNIPKFRIEIDTQALNKADNGVVTERGVRITLFTGIKAPAEKRAAVLAAINDFNRRKVFSATYLDTDGEVILDWTLNVMAQGLPTEYVYDVLARQNKLWGEFYPELTAAMQ